MFKRIRHRRVAAIGSGEPGSDELVRATLTLLEATRNRADHGYHPRVFVARQRAEQAIDRVAHQRATIASL